MTREQEAAVAAFGAAMLEVQIAAEQCEQAGLSPLEALQAWAAESGQELPPMLQMLV